MTSNFSIFIFTVIIFVSTCNEPCFQKVVVEVPITVEHQDTMRIGDTLNYIVRVPDKITDQSSGETISLADIDLYLELLVGDMDDLFNPNKGITDFKVTNIQGRLDVGMISGQQVGAIVLAEKTDERIIHLNIIPQRPGRFQFVLYSVYGFFVRDPGKRIDIVDNNDCLEELNILFPINNYSSRGFNIYQDALLDNARDSATLEAYQREGILAFVVVE